MHLRSVLALGAAATVVPLVVAAPIRSAAAADRVVARRLSPAAAAVAGHLSRPTCGDPASSAFPLRSRLYGGPIAYDAGGQRRSFSLRLTNTTRAACRQVHPLMVLVDRERSLTPRQLRLEYRAPGSRDWRPVHFETSDDNENIGLPGGEDGPGFTVPAHGSLTVRLRLGFTADAPDDRVVVSATTMQRRGSDGAWIGDSNHYTFDVRAGGAQLAATGVRKAALLVLGGIAWALMLGGTALVVVARRRSRQPR